MNFPQKEETKVEEKILEDEIDFNSKESLENLTLKDLVDMKRKKEKKEKQKKIKDAEVDGGIDVDKIIMNTEASPDLINSEIKKLLEDGLVYEPRPGRLRYLGWFKNIKL